MKKIQLTLLLFISVFVNAQIAINNPTPYAVCDDDFDGQANFNLLTKNLEVLGSLDSSLYSVSYHYTLDGAENSTDMIYPESYYNNQAFTEIIYVRVEENVNPTNFSTTTLTLVVNLLPSVYPANNLTVIDTPYDGLATFDLTQQDATILGGQTNCVVDYYDMNGNLISNPSSYTNNIYGDYIEARVRNTLTGCQNNFSIGFELIVNFSINQPTPYQICAVNTSGIATFDLTTKDNEIIGQSSTNDFYVYYYRTLSDAQIGNSPLYAEEYMNQTPFNETIYFRVFSNFLNTNSQINSFNLIVGHQPIAFVNNYTINDAPYDGIGTFNLASQSPLIIGNQTNCTIAYYNSIADAENNQNAIQNINAFTNISNPQVVYTKITDSTLGCYTISNLNLIVSNPDHIIIPNINFKNILLSANTENGIAIDANNNQIVIDSNGDNEIQLNEALAVSGLVIEFQEINDLTGIEYFTNLTNLDCTDNHITTLNLSSLVNLTFLDCSNNSLTSLNINGLNNLYYLSCDSNHLNSLDVSSLTNLTTLYCTSNYLVSLNIDNLTNLTEVRCNDNHLTTLNVSNLVNLSDLNCAGNSITNLNLTPLVNLVNLDVSVNLFGTIDVTSLTNLVALSCNNNQLTILNVTPLVNLTNLYCNNNQLTTLDVTHLFNLQYLNCGFNQLTALNVQPLINLQYLSCAGNQLTELNVLPLNNLLTLYCYNNQLTTLDVNSLTNLVSLYCYQNQLTTLNVNGANNLANIYCGYNQLTTLNVSALNNLTHLECYLNHINNLNLGTIANLSYLNCNNNQLTNLNVALLTSLQELHCGSNQFNSLNVSSLVNLTNFDCSNNQLTSINVAPLINLTKFWCLGNLFTTIDVSTLTNLTSFNCTYNPNLTQIFMKNGFNFNLTFNQLDQYYSLLYSNPNLQYVCANDNKIASLVNYFGQNNMQNVVVNSYCTFTPGGSYNTIAGNVKFDANNNGCDNLDAANPFINIKLNDGSGFAYSATNTSGNYNFYTQPGNFVVAPNIENPSWFTISPTSATIPFSGNSMNANQNFCIASNGLHKDLEVIITNTTNARPGFTAKYKIIYRNKGNQTLSGAVAFNFNDNILNFSSASTSPTSQTTGLLSWNYLNLLPFESREINTTFVVNSPVQTPAVNIGDILIYTASITPMTGDDNSVDNQFTFNQTVVGSFDPNDKTCLEGNNVSPTKIGDYLHYNINFENTGTFQAENIVVKDIIDTTKFDINTIQIVNASHPVLLKTNENNVEFQFQNINLAAAQHGNVTFKIKTKSTLVTGNTVTNQANIYFDYNAPVTTNIASTTFQTLSNPEQEIDTTIGIYPNPTKNSVSITSSNEIKSVELYDIQGRVLLTKLVKDLTTTIDISDKTNGIYFLKIASEKGIKIEKLIKE